MLRCVREYTFILPEVIFILNEGEKTYQSDEYLNILFAI